MPKFLEKKAFTLVEVLVAVSLFSVVGLLALTVFVNITRIQGRLAMENSIYEDARFMMERISREIRNNAIDYEEYFNKAANPANQYGELYGCYAAQFYNPGMGDYRTPNLTANPGTLGAQCNNGDLYTGQECVVFRPSIDLNTGTYPYKGASPAPSDGEPNSNAFCPLYLNAGLGCTPPAAPAINAQPNDTKELYLIDKDGKVKTYLARKKVSSNPEQFSLAMLKKVGEDQNTDGLTETWKGCTGNTFCCASEFDCPSGLGGLGKLEDSLDFSKIGSGIYTGFVPVSPLRTNVTSLNFQIIPGEDPRKAFAEPTAVYQPSVRITLTVQPAADQLAKFGNPGPGQIPTIVLQTTISSRIQSEVKSYLGSDTHEISGCNLTS